MKRKMRNLFRTILMWFTYPRELADAVNRAVTNEELDAVISDRRWRV